MHALQPMNSWALCPGQGQCSFYHGPPRESRDLPKEPETSFGILELIVGRRAAVLA